MIPLRRLIRRGDPAIWFTGTGLGISLLMIAGMVGLILVNGLGFFWPKPLTQLALADGTSLLGELVAREAIPQHGAPTAVVHRIQMKLGNRDLSGADFRWVDEAEIKSRSLPREAVYVERREYGPFIGVPVRLSEDEKVLASGADAVWQALQPLVAKAEADRDHMRDIERDEIGAINAAIEAERLATRAAELRAAGGSAVDVAAVKAATRAAPGGAQGAVCRGRSSPRRKSSRKPRGRASRSRPSTERRRTSRRSTSSARIGPTSCRSAGGSRSTPAVCGSFSPATRASRTPRAASFPRSSAP